MSPRPDVSMERKDQILEAALRVFSRLGLDKARLDDIVAEFGLSKGALYWYFRSKDEIVIAMLESLFSQEMTRLRTLPDARDSARERLLAFADTTAGNFKSWTRLMPILYEFYALAFRKKAIRRALKVQFQTYLELMEPLIQQGIEQGEFRPVDVRQAALAAGAIIEGTLLLWIFAPDLVQLDDQLRAGLRLFLDGLAVPAALPAAGRLS